MTKLYEYKGYTGTAEVSDENELWGKILFINDLVLYGADTLGALEQAFSSSVDDYLETCKALGDEPDKPFRGSFNVRISPELHRKCAYESAARGSSLNEFVSIALEDAVGKRAENKVYALEIGKFYSDALDKLLLFDPQPESLKKTLNATQPTDRNETANRNLRIVG